MSSFLEEGENLEETEFVDAVNGYDSSANNDSVINGEILDDDEEPFENEPEPFENDAELEQKQEVVSATDPLPGPELSGQGPEQKEETTDNVTFTITDGPENYIRNYYPMEPLKNNLDGSVGIMQTPIPRRAKPKFFNTHIQRPGQHLKTMFF
jgi:hypothetical protein